MTDIDRAVERILASAASLANCAIYDEQDLAGRVPIARRNFRNLERLVRAELEARVPQGWQLVPKEPTQEMVQAWHDREFEGGAYIDENNIEFALIVACYRSMLAATPDAPSKEDA